MASKLALFASLLLASAALAHPSSLLEARPARRREIPRPVLVDATGTTSNVAYTDNWAGAVLKESNRTFSTATGTFTVVTPSGVNNSSASAWVGIGGDDCSSALLQTGVEFNVDEDGSISYCAWLEWFPSADYLFTNITIKANDVIRASVTALSTTSGVAYIENLTNGQTVAAILNGTVALCGANVQWIVEDFQVGGKDVPLANFGTVTFSNASATGPGGTYAPSGALLLDIVQHNQTLTSVSLTDSSVSVSYIS